MGSRETKKERARETRGVCDVVWSVLELEIGNEKG